MRGAATLSIEIQIMISRALDNNEYALLSSLDLSTAFDLVDIQLLIKRLKIIGPPNDLVNLNGEWLNYRSCYVDIDENNSCLFDPLLGSILFKVLYWVQFYTPSLMSENFFLLAFADDAFNPKWNISIQSLTDSKEKTIKAITK
jgi:hypothetical protein